MMHIFSSEWCSYIGALKLNLSDCFGKMFCQCEWIRYGCVSGNRIAFIYLFIFIQ